MCFATRWARRRKLRKNAIDAVETANRMQVAEGMASRISCSGDNSAKPERPQFKVAVAPSPTPIASSIPGNASRTSEIRIAIRSIQPW